MAGAQDKRTVRPLPLGPGAGQSAPSPRTNPLGDVAGGNPGHPRMITGAVVAKPDGGATIGYPLVPALGGGILREFATWGAVSQIIAESGWALHLGSGPTTTLAQTKAIPRILPAYLEYAIVDGFAPFHGIAGPVMLHPNTIVPPGHAYLIFVIKNLTMGPLFIGAYATLELPADT